MTNEYPDNRPPVHERCVEHRHSCENIIELKEAAEKMRNSIENCMTTKVALSIQGCFVALLLAMNGLLYEQTSKNLAEFQTNMEKRNQQIVDIFRQQGDLKVQITQLQGSVLTLKENVQDIKANLNNSGR